MRLSEKRLTLLVLMGLVLPLRSGAQNLQGAEYALQQMDAQKPDTTLISGGRGSAAELHHDLIVFREKAPALPPQEAARQWLALVKRYLDKRTVNRFDRFGSFGTGFSEERQENLRLEEVMEALPPPVAWSALAAEIQARYTQTAKPTPFDLGLLMFSHVLQNDTEAQWRDMEALKAQIAASKEKDDSDLTKTFAWLTKQLMKQSTDPQQIQQGVELQMAFPEVGSRWDGLRIPDLVTLLGSQKAEALLSQALLTTHAEIEIPVGEATRSLARKLALELADQLKVPAWQLANSLDATELYEALIKQSGKTDEPEAKLARLYYMVGLVLKGRTEEAALIAKSIDRDMRSDYWYQGVSEALDRSGQAGTFVAFLHTQLAQNPRLPLWDIYIPSAARVGQSGPMLTLARAAAVRNDLDPVQLLALRMSLYKALLAADQVEEGVAVIRRMLSAPADSTTRGTSDRFDAAMQLIRIGRYLKRDDWITTGVTFIQTAIRTHSDYIFPYRESMFGRLLREVGRSAEAEKTLVGALVHEVKSQYHGRSGGPAGVYEGKEELDALAQFYCHVGRYADVMTLIDRAPNWMAKDVANLNMKTEGIYGDPPLAYAIAVALAETGKRTEAIALLQRLLLTQGGFDPAYERLLALQGQKAMPFLDTLFRHNRFEERPLIWKAVLLQRAGRLAEAEKMVRAAIAIDPSDEDEGHGDRMRAYSVLAGLREARGDHAQARQYREVVQAIRISEHADDLKEVGLTSRAIALYQEALKHFTDAYCIQSRLAMQMMQRGNLQAAAEHYRRAYELMPSSFGRMETHCFGCEGVFREETAQNAAERVFQELLKKTPNKPQLHYLMGYLRQQQGRYAEALVSYREAVALDPDYVNAWRQIELVGKSIAIPQTLRNTAALNRMRLQGDARLLLEVTDLPAVWTAVQTARAANPVQGLGAIYPFAVCKASLDSLETVKGTGSDFLVRHQGMDGNFWVAMGEEASIVTPSPNEVIAHQEVVSLLIRLLDDQLLLMQNQSLDASDPLP